MVYVLSSSQTKLDEFFVFTHPAPKIEGVYYNAPPKPLRRRRDAFRRNRRSMVRRILTGKENKLSVYVSCHVRDVDLSYCYTGEGVEACKDNVVQEFIKSKKKQSKSCQPWGRARMRFVNVNVNFCRIYKSQSMLSQTIIQAHSINNCG